MITMLKLEYTPLACCWVHRRGQAQSLLAMYVPRSFLPSSYLLPLVAFPLLGYNAHSNSNSPVCDLRSPILNSTNKAPTQIQARYTSTTAEATAPRSRLSRRSIGHLYILLLYVAPFHYFPFLSISPAPDSLASLSSLAFTHPFPPRSHSLLSLSSLNTHMSFPNVLTPHGCDINSTQTSTTQ